MRFALPAICILALTGTALAAIKTKSVEYKQGDTVLEGYLAWDDASTAPRPAVIVIHEWWGNNDYSHHRAEQIAGLGYVGFAIDMYGKGKVTTEVAKATEWSNQIKTDLKLGMARLQAGLDTLKAQSMVDPNKIAAIGYCFGGTCVLQIARNNMPILGVVSFHGGIGPLPGQTETSIKPKVLACHGADDPFVPQTDVMAFMDEMKKANADWQLNQYSGAIHAFSNPDVGQYHLQGTAYNKEADMRSWQAMKDFLKEIFGE
jgi:dienelactone hydrolase